MILPHWVSVALLLLASALMILGVASTKRGAKARQVFFACGMFVLIVGMTVSSLRGLGHTRDRIEEAVTELGLFANTGAERIEAKQAAEKGLSDLSEDLIFLIASAVLLGVSGSQLILTLARPKSAANPPLTGTPA